jgi:hypothetical protein
MATAERGRQYLHKKGGRYQVLDIATHSETMEEMVVYISLDHGGTWVRPRAIFEEEGRFEFLELGEASTRVRKLKKSLEDPGLEHDLDVMGFSDELDASRAAVGRLLAALEEDVG